MRCKRRIACIECLFHIRIRLEAQRSVTVPEDVLGLLADLREMLQDTMEPPVYVSDRRLVKAIALLKVPPSPAGCPCCASAEPHTVQLAPPCCMAMWAHPVPCHGAICR